MLRTLQFIVVCTILCGCVSRPARETATPSQSLATPNAVVDATVLHGVKGITVTHNNPEEASFDEIIRFDEPKTVVDGTCESPQGPMRCLWWELGGRECTLMPNYHGRSEECRDLGDRRGTSRHGFGLPSTSIAFDREDGAVTTHADALTHLQVLVMIGRQGTQLD